jgi:hypothetical protein
VTQVDWPFAILRVIFACLPQSYLDYDKLSDLQLVSRVQYLEAAQQRLQAAALQASRWNCNNIALLRGVTLSTATGYVKYLIMNASKLTAAEFVKQADGARIETLENLATDVLTALQYLHSCDPPIAHRRVTLSTISVYREEGRVTFRLPLPVLVWNSASVPLTLEPASTKAMRKDLTQLGQVIAETAAAVLKCDVPADELPSPPASRGLVVLDRLSPRLAEVVRDCLQAVDGVELTAASALYALRPSALAASLAWSQRVQCLEAKLEAECNALARVGWEHEKTQRELTAKCDMITAVNAQLKQVLETARDQLASVRAQADDLRVRVGLRVRVSGTFHRQHRCST